MSAAPWTTMKREIERDRYGRPLVIPPEGGPTMSYTRATTFVGALEDTYGIGVWKQRMTALGLAERPDLLLRVVSERASKDASEAQRRAANKLVDAAADDAFVAAGGNAAATVGTALHLLTEKLDRGEDMGVLPELYAADVKAYEVATSELKANLIEQFCVQDKLKVGGTPDRVVTYKRKRYIADLKTGSIDKGYLKIAAQLAMYARSRTYDIATGERAAHGAEIDRGIIVHLPAGSGTCTLYWVDLLIGWEAVLLARLVREARQQSFKAVVYGWEDTFSPKANLIDKRDNHPLGPAPVYETNGGGIPELIACASTIEEVKGIWHTYQNEWSDELTKLAAARVADLS